MVMIHNTATKMINALVNSTYNDSQRVPLEPMSRPHHHEHDAHRQQSNNKQATCEKKYIQELHSIEQFYSLNSALLSCCKGNEITKISSTIGYNNHESTNDNITIERKLNNTYHNKQPQDTKTTTSIMTNTGACDLIIESLLFFKCDDYFDENLNLYEHDHDDDYKNNNHNEHHSFRTHNKLVVDQSIDWWLPSSRIEYNHLQKQACTSSMVSFLSKHQATSGSSATPLHNKSTSSFDQDHQSCMTTTTTTDEEESFINHFECQEQQVRTETVDKNELKMMKQIDENCRGEIVVERGRGKRSTENESLLLLSNASGRKNNEDLMVPDNESFCFSTAATTTTLLKNTQTSYNQLAIANTTNSRLPPVQFCASHTSGASCACLEVVAKAKQQVTYNTRLPMSLSMVTSIGSKLMQAREEAKKNLFLFMLPSSTLVAIILIALLSCSLALASAQNPSDQPTQANVDLLTILPPFAPTRRPASLAHQQQHLYSVAHQSNNPTHNHKNNKYMNHSLQQQDGVRQHQVVVVGSTPPIAASSTSSAQFTRTNELDAFLDEMNHKELQTVASGKSIDDLFQPKPYSQSAQQHVKQHKQQPVPKPHQSGRRSVVETHDTSMPLSSNVGNNDGGTTHLMGSQSEQQIYSECALILQRTYVKNIDDPKHQLVPFGKTEQACISYKHIDRAIEQAKHQLKFREFAKMRKRPIDNGPGKPPIAPLDVIHATLEPPEDLVAAIGEINMATTQIIADQFDLSNDELLNGLPLIDMSKTKFWDICPLFVKQDIKCEISRFRTFTGHCNNLKHPTWGAARTPYARYLPPVHPDGIWVPRKSIVSEITFDLGIGHRETHANIAPSMPLPIVHNELDEHGHRHAFPAMPSTTTTTTSNADYHHRLGLAPTRTIHTPPHSNALDEPADDLSHLAHNDELNEEDMALASSVHFVRRARLDSVSSIHHQNHLVAPQHQPSTDALHHREQFDVSQQQQAGAIVASAANAHAHLLPHMAATNAAAVPHHHHHHHHHASSRSIPQELPSARLITSIVHRDMDVPNHDFTVLFMSWGQLLDHDMTRASQPPSTIKCCANPATGEQASGHKLCLPIQVPENDPFYSKFGVKCLEFRRTLAGVRPNCVLGPRVHQNANTSPIDANFVYGSAQATADSLRLFKGGRLRDRDWFHREGLKPLLPAQEIEPDNQCLGRPKDLFCFLAGDVRVNEQTHLTVLHTLYMREHNRIADKLSELNAHWDDERIFQEARHIVAASVQHVLINEYIPLLIGRKMTELYNLTIAQSYVSAEHQHDAHHPHQAAFWHGYDASVTTSVSNSFAAAAFRQGHTFVQSTIDRFNKFHEFVASEKLRHLFMQPFLLYQPGVMDELISGLINKQSQSYDPFISEEISGHLFQPPESEFGHDLAAINLQRGRDQGLPGYNLFREWCGLPRAETFEQLEPYLTNHTAFQYSRIYKHVDDIDLWSGGISERKLPGSAIGPTFACIIARQFSNTRRGDRFWYENPGLPSSFTPDQLAEIRKASIAKLLCSNADDLPTIQRWAFRMPHPVLNPRIDCHQIPEIDLQYWQEE